MRKTTPLQEAHAPGPLFARSRRLAVFARQDAARALQLALRGNALHELALDALCLQVPADFRRAVLARKPARALLGEALVGELFFCR